ncbi:unnamed protein product, partial [Ixodes persulcatus]
GGLKYYREYCVPELAACDESNNLTIYMYNLMYFCLMFKRFPAEGLKPGYDDLVTIQNAIVWLDD